MITASIVAYHTPINELSHFLECIVHSNIDVLYLVDNSSNDSLRELSSMSRKIVYIYSDNLGFGHGHNIAIQKSIAVNADYHIVINPDMYWEGKVIEELQEFMNHHPDCGLVMPKVLYPTGEIQYLCKLLPTPMDLFGRRFLPFKGIQQKRDERFELHAFGYDKIIEVPSLSGCFMFMRVDVLKRTGGFDERFSAYCQAGRRLLIAFVALIVFSPLFLFCYLAVKREDGGPAIFKQERIGRFGRPFYIYKFQSMRLDAEKFGPALYAGGEDPRLTRIGKFLREHHLDELPQLWNVFIGDMAFIGPRSERKFYIDRIMEQDSRYRFLYQIRPGVTSYATLYNGYTDTMEKMLRRLRYDLFYLEHRSLLFDFKILVKTFLNIAFGKKF